MNIRLTIIDYFKNFINLIFPRICIHCNTILVHQEEHLCTSCRLSLPKTNFHLQNDNLLKQKFVYEPKVKQVAAYIHYNKKGIAQDLIHEMKYRNQPTIGEMIGRWYGHDIKKAKWPIDIIVPVPLHKSKMKRRGFNQSEAFAKGLSESLNVPVNADLVKRSKKTATQTRKSKVERWQNLESVYSIEHSEQLKSKSVLVVDDVLTTGATIGMLISELVLSDVKELYIVTIAAGH